MANQDAENAINLHNETIIVGSRPVRLNWATRKSTTEHIDIQSKAYSAYNEIIPNTVVYIGNISAETSRSTFNRRSIV